MATRAAIFIPNEDGASYTRIYCHFDGYPSAMLPALKSHDPKAILAAKQIRSISKTKIDPFEDAKEPDQVVTTKLPEWADYGYILMGQEWYWMKNVPD